MIDGELKKFQGIEGDSRLVKPGMLFIGAARKDSLQHCIQALNNGATAIISYEENRECVEKLGGIFFSSKNPFLDLANLASKYYAPLPKFNIAVTGTNGKSSVTFFVKQLLELLGKKAAAVGTIGVVSSIDMDESFIKTLPSLTSMDSFYFIRLLAYLKSKQVDYVAFEASSIGIDQFRCYGVPLCAAAFTNLTQDHLDYHANMEEYFIAKSKLFSEVLDKGKGSIINLNSTHFERLKKICEIKGNDVISYALNNDNADCNANIINTTAEGFYFDFKFKNFSKQNLHAQLIGAFQLENLMCATALLVSSGFDIESIVDLFSQIHPVKGRMESVPNKNGFGVFVDYAHTPDALERAILSLREHTKNNLWVLFGCGGNRDALKRPLMGRVACMNADHVIVTDDNPRFENAGLIRKEVLDGCDNNAIEIAGRFDAIFYAVSNLKKGDNLLVAGKGHEKVQIINGIEEEFDDYLKIKEVFERLEN